MDNFESLLEELKGENLLEDTVIKSGSKEPKPVVHLEKPKSEEVILTDYAETDDLIIVDNVDYLDETESLLNEKPETPLAEILEVNAVDPIETIETNSISVDSDQIEIETNQTAANVNSTNGVEFYRKRATSEVSFLQMVEHVFAGLEREQMKIVPKAFDALAVKKILHAFLQVSKESNTSEQTQAEFQLLQETENWYSSLTHRDRRISINHLRRYCESARPPLSAPALVSLARFYRNSPYSEQARGKFDFIVTRLFSRDVENERREMVFSRDELILHLKELYAEWSSVPLYSIDEDGSEILLIALKFEDFITEAAVAGSFDELIKNDFFNRLRLFKKSTNENFFSPLVVVASIESNIKIGNRYVELLEKEEANKSVYEDKYGFLHDQTISDATGKTFQLVELLSRKTENFKPKQPPTETFREMKFVPEETKDFKEYKETPNAKKTARPKAKKIILEPIKTDGNQLSDFSAASFQQMREKGDIFGVNRWLLIAVILTVIGAVCFYVMSSISADAKEINDSNNVYKLI